VGPRTSFPASFWERPCGLAQIRPSARQGAPELARGVRTAVRLALIFAPAGWQAKSPGLSTRRRSRSRPNTPFASFKGLQGPDGRDGVRSACIVPHASPCAGPHTSPATQAVPRTPSRPPSGPAPSGRHRSCRTPSRCPSGKHRRHAGARRQPAGRKAGPPPLPLRPRDTCPDRTPAPAAHCTSSQCPFGRCGAGGYWVFEGEMARSALHIVPLPFREVRCWWVLGRDDVRSLAPHSPTPHLP